MSSIKTTIAGILMILTAIIGSIQDGKVDLTKLAEAFGGVGLMVAKDNSKKG